LVMNISNIPPDTTESLARALRMGAVIAAVATYDVLPFTGSHHHINVIVTVAAPAANFVLPPASPHYPLLYGLKLLAGRVLSEQRGTGGRVPSAVRGGEPFNILINASAARRLGWSPLQAVGKTLGLASFLHNKVTIVGVIADSKQDGPKSPIQATLYMYWR